MKKVILIPLMASSALMACQQSNETTSQTAIEVQQQTPKWVGQYAGSTPCMGCLSRCEDCPGMAVALTLYPNQSFELLRESLSGHNAVERVTGTIRFRDDSGQQIELLNVSTRNLIFVNLKDQLLEIGRAHV